MNFFFCVGGGGGGGRGLLELLSDEIKMVFLFCAAAVICVGIISGVKIVSHLEYSRCI